jgi:hypothetical protein
MAGFIRRFTFDPGLEELLAIEGVVIIDREPPAALTGVGTGLVTIVGEFEDGPFESGVEVAGSADFLNTWGGFGHTYAGIVSNNPCARSRLADGAVVPEYWNGNGFIALAKKQFRQLVVVRVDTSVGSIEFRRLATIKGNTDFTFDLEPADAFVFENTGANTATATFTATAGTVNSGVGAYPTTFAGGEQMTFNIDGVETTAVFEVTDQLQVDVINRLNTAAGYTAFVDAGGGVTSFTGRQRGTGGSIQVVSLTALVATKTGFAAGAAIPGTGNVANIDQVTQAEVSSICIAAAAAAAAPFVVRVDRDEDNKLCLTNTSLPLTGALTVVSNTATALGFVAAQTASAATGTAGSIPAGTRVRNVGATEWVTMESIAVAASGTGAAGPYESKIRHAVDDTTGALALAATINNLPFVVPGVGFFAVSNPLPTVAALTDNQIEVAYDTAIETTKNLSSIVKKTNVIISARASNAVRTALRANVLDASSQGAYGRMSVIRPPLKTTRAIAKGTTLQPGVGAYRSQRVIYAYPGVSVMIPQIAARGTAGGVGFTADGVIDVGFDTWVASLMSQLPPEENPGQSTDFLVNVLGIETGNTDVQNLTLADYRAFKSSGIAAYRNDEGTSIIQSGITSVDPATQSSLKNINRQRMSDFITDTLSIRLNTFSKKLASRTRRANVMGEIDAFMRQLQADERIDSYLIDGKSGNTATTIAAGLFRIILKVKTIPSMDVIVLDAEVGETVTITAV